MKIELKEIKELERELVIEVEPETVNSEMEKKFTEIRRTVTLNGFRKGKAPLNVIKSRYADQARIDVADDLIRQTYSQAVREKNLLVATRPTVTDMGFSDDGGFTYTATVEIFPEIASVNCDNLVLETIDTEATDEEVGEMVEHYRRQFSELRPVDRPAMEGDVVLVDLAKLADSKGVLSEDNFSDSEVDLGNKLTVKEFKEELPGMKAGDEKEFTVRYDDDYSDPHFAGAEIRYHCTLKAVKERIMPEFDDAFASRTGQVETALELRMKIRQDIKRHKDADLTRLHKRDTVRQICESNQVPVPEGLINDYLDSVVKDLKEQNPDVNEEEIRSHYRQIGINSMRWDILWHRLSEQEKIEVLPSDTENWINGFAGTNNMTPEQAREALQKSGKVASLRESLLEDKVLEFLIDRSRKDDSKG